MGRSSRSVAVLALGGLAAAGLTACGSGSPAGGAGPGSGTPSQRSSPVGTKSPTPGTSAPSGGLQLTIPCRSQVLSARIAPRDGSPQLQLTNTGTSACSISGWVTIAGTDRTGERVSATVTKVPLPAAPSRLVLQKGAHAWAGLQVAGGTCTGATVVPPVDTRPLTVQVLDAGGRASTLAGCPVRIGVLTDDAATAHL